MSGHAKKDLEYHDTIGHEYHRLVVQPRLYTNSVLFRHADRLVRPGDRMLDIGCGTGQMILRYGHLFRSVIGVDHSDAMLRSAKNEIAKSGMSNVQFVRADLFEYLTNTEGGRFQLITCVGCLHHQLPDTIFPLLKAAEKMLDPGGLMILADPVEVSAKQPPRIITRWNSKTLPASSGYSVDAEEPDEAPLPRRSMLESVESAGLRIIRTTRGWELFARNHPPTITDKIVINLLNWLYGRKGNVMAVVATK